MVWISKRYVKYFWTADAAVRYVSSATLCLPDLLLLKFRMCWESYLLFLKNNDIKEKGKADISG